VSDVDQTGTYHTLPGAIQFFSQEAGIEYGGLQRPEGRGHRGHRDLQSPTEATGRALNGRRRALNCIRKSLEWQKKSLEWQKKSLE
jgi:hypothetical protein